MSAILIKQIKENLFEDTDDYTIFEKKLKNVDIHFNNDLTCNYHAL